MTLYERLRWRLRMLRLGLTLKPIAGAQDPDPDPDPKDPSDPADPDPSDPDPEDPKQFDLAYVKKLRAENAKHRREAQEARSKAQKLEDQDKTEAQKLADRASSAEQQAQSSTSEAARLRVALKKGLTEQQAKRLVGDSEEELEADADELLESFTSTDETDNTRRRPRERLRPGAAPSSDPEETDPIKLAEKIPRMY